MKPSGAPITLSDEIAERVEERIRRTIRGIEETLREILERGEVEIDDVKELLKALEPSFSLLSQRWVLEILYLLLIRGSMRFNELKGVTGASSRSLSSKLKALVREGYVKRIVVEGPPLRIKYALTEKGRGAALLSLPVLYYIARQES